VVEGAPLLREYTSKAYRGFKSHPLRHFPLLIFTRARSFVLADSFAEASRTRKKVALDCDEADYIKKAFLIGG
jgi:hypothetical protein